MAAVKTFVRPMQGWWRKNPYFVRYMIREGSCVFLAIYGVILLVGAVPMGSDDAWRAALTNPFSILFHWRALLTVGYHAYTWWKVSPKTAPDILIAGRPIPEALIAGGGLLATIGTSILVYVIVRWM